MPEEKKETEATDEDKKVEKPAEAEQQKSEEDKSQGDKADFEKKEEVVPSGKYNAAIRKQRELELEKRELERKLSERATIEPVKKTVIKDEEEDEGDEDDEFFEEKKPKKKEIEPDIIEPISKELKELRERVDKREADDKKTQRTAFFKAHPEYLNDSEKWQELLDEMDNSLNPHSKDSYYKQLTKAHRLISGDQIQNTEIDKKKTEMATELAGKGDGSQKAPDNSKHAVDERSLRLAQKMPKGYEFKPKV